MDLPAPLLTALDRTLERAFGAGVHVRGHEPVPGGCIAEAAHVSVSGAPDIFVKWQDDAPKDLFLAESRGLEELAAAKALKVPQPLFSANAQGEAPAWLAMEWLTVAEPGSGSAEALGRGLARLHRHTAERFGFGLDNFIGPTIQLNGWHHDWPGFFRDKRLGAMAVFLQRQGLLDKPARGLLMRTLERVGDLLAEPGESPSLLHGDLWAGNRLALAGGEPALVDPAVHYGCREADLAMMELFGSPPEPFWRAYEEMYPLAPGYAERRDLYNLYHLMNHALLFGGGYMEQATAVMRRYAG
ncbi:fructosamine kinase family protein [bacterium]|nr:fructosamine kinase family protein [bacterium]